MNIFTQIVNEDRKIYDDATALLMSEVTRYINKVNRVLPTTVKNAIHLTQKYGLLDAQSISEIKNASKPSLKKLSEKYDISLDKIEDLWRVLKELKQNIRLLPQFQSEAERKEIEAGKLSMNDLTIDLETDLGRNAATKMYSPMIYKIVNQFVGKSKMNKTDLMSSALLGFTDAMNSWDRSKNVPFKTYAGTRIRQQILLDMNELYPTLSGFNDYARQKGYSAKTSSIDSPTKDDLSLLDILPDNNKPYKDTSYDNHPEKWDEVIDILSKKFGEKHIDIFRRYYGINCDQDKVKDIAKSYGMSDGNVINGYISPMLKYIRGNTKALSLLNSIMESYNISLIPTLAKLTREEIIEALINDDIFILLEELNRWSNKGVFCDTLENALSVLPDSTYILNVLKEDFEFLDGSFKKNKKLIILFLNEMYPTESMSRKSDVALLDYMMEIQEAYKKHCK